MQILSFLLEKDTDEIQRIGQALRVNQRFRAPREFGANIGGERAVGVGFDDSGFGTVNVRKTPGFSDNIGRVETANRAADSRFGTLIGDLSGNTNPYIRARVRPTEELVRQNVASVSRDVGRRNIQGSLGQNQIQNAQFLGAREVADQGALATTEAINSQLAAEAGRVGVGRETLDIAQAQLNDELQQINIAMDALSTSLGDQEQLSQMLSGTTADQVDTPINQGGDILVALDAIFGG